MDNKNDKLIKAINDWKKSTDGAAVQIHGKKYSLVSTRVAVARRNLGSSLDLKSTVIHHDDKRVIVQVDAYIDGKHVSSGLGEEYRSANFINKTSALEVAETSAAGRSLAFLNFCDDDIASAEEVSNSISASDRQLQMALQDLNKVSHLGSYKEWISKNKPLFENLKANNPLAYDSVLEKFTAAKNKLETKIGVINGNRK